MPAAPKPRVKKQKARFHARRDYDYQAFIRTQPCILVGRSYDSRVQGTSRPHRCMTRAECCHVQTRGAGADDRGNCVPMCSEEHGHQHAIGTKTFQARWGVDLKAEAGRLWTLYQDAVPPFQET